MKFSTKIYISMLPVMVMALSAWFLTKSGEVAHLPDISSPDKPFWQIRSLDTMKFSRDLAREKKHDPEFIGIINDQLERIAAVGATHAAIGTPYDEEFRPVLKTWVQAARSAGLKVWFRGNFSGWENWFDYPDMSPEDHKKQVAEFILNNPDLFEDGDVFTSCPECENGGPGDPRQTGRIEEFRQFILDEQEIARASFARLGLKVETNYYSMNGDVLKLSLDKETLSALGGVAAMDHYTSDPGNFVRDIHDFISERGAQVAVSEFGAPVPDIHGEISEAAQADWIGQALRGLSAMKGVPAVNYWTADGGSTALWNPDGTPRLAAAVIKKYFQPEYIFGLIMDDSGRPLAGARLEYDGGFVMSNQDGYFELPLAWMDSGRLKATHAGYLDREVEIRGSAGRRLDIAIAQNNPGLWLKIRTALDRFF